MFMQLIPSWGVTFVWQNESHRMRVKEDDLDAFLSTLRFNEVQNFTVAKEDPYHRGLFDPVSDDEIE